MLYNCCILKKDKAALLGCLIYIRMNKIGGGVKLLVHNRNTGFVSLAFVAVAFAIAACNPGAVRRTYIILVPGLNYVAVAIVVFAAGSKGDSAEDGERKHT